MILPPDLLRAATSSTAAAAELYAEWLSRERALIYAARYGGVVCSLVRAER